MFQLKGLTVLTTIVIASLAGSATAQEVPSQITTSVGFNLVGNGVVSNVTLSTALSNANVFSSAVANNGGSYSEAFASSGPFTFENAGMPGSINRGDGFGPVFRPGTPSTVSILAPGEVIINVDPQEVGQGRVELD
jgi:hypothetical protein